MLLQSGPEDYDVLREQVLKPAIDAFAPLAPEPTPHPSTFDYQIEEVAFPGGAPDVELAGTLTLPEGPGPHPVVITMSGSGPSDRDESLKPISALKPFAVLADALTSAGVGVLRYDDRGVGASTGDPRGRPPSRTSPRTLPRPSTTSRRARTSIPSASASSATARAASTPPCSVPSDPRVSYIGMMAPAVVDGISPDRRPERRAVACCRRVRGVRRGRRGIRGRGHAHRA